MNNKVLVSTTAVLAVVLVASILYLSGNGNEANSVSAQAIQTDIVMYKNPGCQCCDKWAAYMRSSGFTVDIKPVSGLGVFKTEQGIPYQTRSCHTALVDGYVVEGHVPVEDVKRLLEEQPEATGIAVPGMPAGSPGMPSPNPEPYKVYLIDNDGSLSVFAEHGI